jgi:hypothetical protein
MKLATVRTNVAQGVAVVTANLPTLGSTGTLGGGGALGRDRSSRPHRRSKTWRRWQRRQLSKWYGRLLWILRSSEDRMRRRRVGGPFQGTQTSLLGKNGRQGVTEGRWCLPMKELGANSLKLRTQAHQKVIDSPRIPVLRCGYTVGTGQAVGGLHLITLAPKRGDLSEKLLDRAVTLISGRKRLQQGVAKSLTGRPVEIREVIPDHLGRWKLADGKADGHVTGLANDSNCSGVIILPLGPCLKRRIACTVDGSRGHLREGVRMWRRGPRAINMPPKLEAAEVHAHGGGPRLVVLPSEQNIRAREVATWSRGSGIHRSEKKKLKNRPTAKEECGRSGAGRRGG